MTLLFFGEPDWSRLLKSSQPLVPNHCVLCVSLCVPDALVSFLFCYSQPSTSAADWSSISAFLSSGAATHHLVSSSSDTTDVCPLCAVAQHQSMATVVFGASFRFHQQPLQSEHSVFLLGKADIWEVKDLKLERAAVR